MSTRNLLILLTLVTTIVTACGNAQNRKQETQQIRERLRAVRSTLAEKESANNSEVIIPDVEMVCKFVYEDYDNFMSGNPPAGLHLILKEIDENGYDGGACGDIAYGNNVRATTHNDGTCEFEATGSHAFYIHYGFCSSSMTEINFKTKQDRDAFMTEFKKTSHYKRDLESIYGTYQFEDNGWFGIWLSFPE